MWKKWPDWQANAVKFYYPCCTQQQQQKEAIFGANEVVGSAQLVQFLAALPTQVLTILKVFFL